MKLTKLTLLASMAVALASCSSDENSGASKVNPTDALAVKELVADFGVGQLSVSTANYKYANGFTASAPRRVLGNYEGCASFASKADAVAIPAEYLDATEPAVPADAIDLSTVNPYAWPEGTYLVAGQSYYIDSNYSNNNYLNYGSAEAGDVTIYVKEGADVDAAKINLADWTKANIVVLKGAKLTTTKSAKSTKNYGTLVQNGLYQSEGQTILNYGTMECTGTIQIEGTLYSANDFDALVKGAGKLYVAGNFNAQENFGLAGELYVGKDMTGDVNIQNGLVAHVMGNVSTEKIAKYSGSQMMVEGNFTGTELQLEANAPELVVKGTTSLSGDFHTATGSKGYFELLECENFTANASDIWVGCKSIARDKFELNGNAKFTMANGVYVSAGRAEFAAGGTQMVMMDNAFFDVAKGICIRDVGDVKFNGDGEKNAIVRCATLAANYEDFSETFVGNIGVDFEAWDYNGSTGLIDQNKNLPRLKATAAATRIVASDCNPGYPDPTPTTCDLAVELPMDIQGEWIIQPDDFAIHNGDKLYERFAVVADHSAGSELDGQYVLVTPDDNVVVTLTDICDMYEEYKNATNAEGVPYVSEEGILTVETYLWPAKKYYDEEKGCDVIEPIDPETFGCYPDGKYLIGTAEQPAFYVANEKYNVYVSAYAGYNGGGNGAAMTTYVKVSFHISPVAAE